MRINEMPDTDTEALIRALEDALLDYVEKYGLTDKARSVLNRQL